MAVQSPLLKPLGVAAAAIATFEALGWGILSLLGLLACEDVFSTPEPVVALKIHDYLIEVKDKALVFMSLYVASSVVWFIVSVLLLYDFLKNEFRYLVLVCWATVTFGVCVLDIVSTVMFGLDLGDKQSGQSGGFSAEVLAPLIILILSARGVTLWLVNLAAAVYLSIEAHKLRTGIYSDTRKQQRTGTNLTTDSPSLYEPMPAERDTYSSINPAYQPEPLSAWNIQSPTVGDMKRGAWNFQDNPSPARIFPRVGRPISTPVAPVAPLPIPHPDYSPPLGRPIKHEPNSYEAPLKSALKKPMPYGRTIL